MSTAHAAALANKTADGAAIVTAPGDWTAVHAPASATQATATKAAGTGTVRHVCTGIYAAFAQPTATPVAFTGNVVLRDGATGAGTVIWQQAIAVPATASESRAIDISGLSIIGSAATAMTLEFTAAGGTATFETITLTGHDIT